MKTTKFIFFGKILGFYYELDESNTKPLEDSKIAPASTVAWFKENARKVYDSKDVKIVWHKVG